ncbi:MAG: hypothetical protein IPG74_05610 [Flavobacteriales bacterium]|nr:hypothetical protein [Flavobacteriales bacterium]
MMEQDIAANKEAKGTRAGSDIVIKEFHLPVNEEVNLTLRSRDIIHSAFLPHFRAQMNLVPGQGTVLKMTPTITTDSMRDIMANPEFNYILMCNKIRGASHYNMQMDLGDREEERIRRMGGRDQQEAPFEGAPAAEVPPADGTVVSDSTVQNVMDSTAVAAVVPP